MNTRRPYPYGLCAISLVFTLPASGQIATSNEDDATGAYSSEVDSSFTSEGRFGPRTAIDDLRADVDRDREQIERIRLKQLREHKPPPAEAGPPPAPEAQPGETPPDDARDMPPG